MEPIILRIDAYEAICLLDALNLIPPGDACYPDTMTDPLRDRLRAHWELATAAEREKLKAWGIGSYEDRPQG